MRRVKTLERILAVYRMLEEVREAEAAIAAGDVREAERSISCQHEEVRQARGEERDAIRDGDDVSWAISTTRQQTALIRRRRLEQSLIERQQRSTAARQNHIDSLQWRERMQSLTDAAQAAFDLERERKEQAAADDRYLTQRRTHRVGAASDAGEVNE